MNLKLIIVLLAFAHLTFAQVGIGKWREHLPYSQGVAVCKAESKIYCAAYPSLYTYDLNDNSIEKLSKVNGLSDIGINVVKYSETYKTLIIGYSTGNIDLIVNNEIINVSDVKRSLLQADKSINEIFIYEQYAYLSTGFGIVVFDIERKEIKETYVPGTNGNYLGVNEITIKDDTLFAATVDGIYYGNMQQNLADFQNWKQMGGLPEGNYNTIVSFDDKILTNFKFFNSYDKDTAFVYQNGTWEQVILGSSYNHGNITDINVSKTNSLLISYEYGSDILNSSYVLVAKIFSYGGSFSPPHVNETIENEGTYWLADKYYGLIYVNGNTYENYKPAGPVYDDAWGMDYNNGHLWVAAGTLTPNLKNNYSDHGIAHFYQNEWFSYYGGVFTDSLRDIHTLVTHPNEPEHVYAASWGGGLLEFNNGKIAKIYNETNSAIQSINLFPWRGIGGLAFDSNKVLWMTNSGLVGEPITNPLLAYDLNGNWYSYTLNNLLNSNPLLRNIMIDKRGYKWMSSNLKGVIVFNENSTFEDTSDDQIILLTVGETSGNLPSNEIYTIKEDVDGKIWIGGSAGLAVFNTPQNVFESEGAKAERFIIQQDTTANYLLSDEAIYIIETNAANQKWIGTKGSGVYLMSADMQEEIYHFTTQNSPLLSDIVYDIEIDDITGEVYFSTDNGLISFMGSATDSEKYDGPAYAFPNPVPPNFTGTIGIRGLPNNSEVKITDISGNLIYETIAEGGTATWNGKSLNGKKAQSGVYIVFASKSDGSEKETVKILFLN